MRLAVIPTCVDADLVPVMPAKAGIQDNHLKVHEETLDPRLRGDDDVEAAKSAGGRDGISPWNYHWWWSQGELNP